LTGIHQRTAPTKINRTDWNDLITFLGGTSSDPQIDATKILLAQGGSLLSTWRYATDLTKIDAAKVAGNIAAAQMQTNVLAAIIAANGIVDADVAAAAAIAKSKLALTNSIVDADINSAAAIAKSKISTNGTWALTDLPIVPQCQATRTLALSVANSTWTFVTLPTEDFDTDTMHDLTTNTHRITIKTAGLYLFSAEIGYEGNATGVRYIVIEKNAATPASGSSYWVQKRLGEIITSDFISVTGAFQMAVNDHASLTAYQNSGVALNVYAATFFAARLSGY